MSDLDHLNNYCSKCGKEKKFARGIGWYCSIECNPKPKDIFVSKESNHERSCPICKGTGRINDPHKSAKEDCDIKADMAGILRAHGYSYRQICKLIGWSSPRSAVIAVQRSGKVK